MATAVRRKAIDPRHRWFPFRVQQARRFGFGFHCCDSPCADRPDQPPNCGTGISRGTVDGDRGTPARLLPPRQSPYRLTYEVETSEDLRPRAALNESSVRSANRTGFPSGMKRVEELPRPHEWRESALVWMAGFAPTRIPTMGRGGPSGRPPVPGGFRKPQGRVCQRSERNVRPSGGGERRKVMLSVPSAPATAETTSTLAGIQWERSLLCITVAATSSAASAWR